jgi:RNA polymerase sigma-70 factor (sigma-E family)
MRTGIAIEQVAEPGRRLEDLYARNAPAALRLAYFLTGNRELAEDLVQEAFVRLAGRFRHLRQPDAVNSYLRRIIVNLFTSHLRRSRLERAWLSRQGGESAVPVSEDDPALRDELWQALRALPDRQRAAIVLRFYEDLPERDAAAVLRCSPGALNQLVVRAMASLRERIQGEDT